MEWDAGAIWRIALGLFLLLLGVGVSFALFRLGSVFKRLERILRDTNTRVIPLLTRVEATLDGLNAELGKVDQITGSVAEIVKVAEHTTTAVQTAVVTPLRKAAGLAAGARASIKSFVAARRRGY